MARLEFLTDHTYTDRGFNITFTSKSFLTEEKNKSQHLTRMVYIYVSVFVPKPVIGVINHPTYRRAVSCRLNNLFPHQKQALYKVPQ